MKTRILPSGGKYPENLTNRVQSGSQSGRPERLGYVYFIHAPQVERIKIGRANDAGARLISLQTASPVDLRLLATVVGGAAEEARLHRKFAAYHWRGEWFGAAEPLLSYIREIAPDCVSDGPDVYRFFERIVSFDKGFHCAACGREFGGPILCYINTDDRVINLCLRCGGDGEGGRIRGTFQSCKQRFGISLS